MSAEITDELIDAARVYARAFRRKHPWKRCQIEDVEAEALYSLVYECRRFDPARHPGGEDSLFSWLHERINWHLGRVFIQAPRTMGRSLVATLDQLGAENWEGLGLAQDHSQHAPDRIAAAREALRRAMAWLSPRERLALLLEAQEVARRDIARELGVTVSAVQQILAAARRHLDWREQQ